MYHSHLSIAYTVHVDRFNPFPTLYLSSQYSLFGAVPTAPVALARRSKAPLGVGYGFPLEIPRPHLSSLDVIRARAGRCHEGGLSSTDERVRGHVLDVTL